jgi:hypothetical protein
MQFRRDNPEKPQFPWINYVVEEDVHETIPYSGGMRLFTQPLASKILFKRIKNDLSLA